MPSATTANATCSRDHSNTESSLFSRTRPTFDWASAAREISGCGLDMPTSFVPNMCLIVYQLSILATFYTSGYQRLPDAARNAPVGRPSNVLLFMGISQLLSQPHPMTTTPLTDIFDIADTIDTFALGHYARVVSALDRRTHKSVAFKVMRPEHLTQDGEMKWEFKAFHN